MRPQTLALTVASLITGTFLAAVGVVLTWQWLDTRENQGQAIRQDRVARFAPAPFQNQPGNVVIDFPDIQGPDIVFNDMAIPQMPNQAAPFAQPIQPHELPKARGVMVPAKDYRLSDPHKHGNLTIFLIHGPDTMKDAQVLTLQEALEQNVAVVHDRGQLFIDNRGKTPLFIQAGDIVKGGNQDRTLPFDMLIPAATNNVPVPALCVEAGRSFPRGNELSTSFGAATEQLPGKNLRLAAYRQAQGDVWANVQALQANLTRNAGGSVQSKQSLTSLQLSLESPRVRTATEACMNDLMNAPADQDDVIGLVVTVNGKIHSADVYASTGLFRKVWPKLLRASAVEALAERQPGAAPAAPSAEAVQAFFADAEQAPAFRQMNNPTTLIRHESARTLLYDTCDPSQANGVLHRSFLAK